MAKKNDNSINYIKIAERDGPHVEIIKENGVFRGMKGSGVSAETARAANDRLTG